MPRYTTVSAIDNDIATEAAQRKKIIGAGPIDKKVNPRMLMFRLTEKIATVAYYDWFMAQRNTLEYQDDKVELRLSDTILMYSDTNMELPVRGFYEIAHIDFFGFPAVKNVFIWMHPSASFLYKTLRIDYYSIFNILVPHHNTLCLSSQSTNAATNMSIADIKEAFVHNLNVYLTTETGTIKLQNFEQLDTNQVWGDDAMYDQRYVSISKQALIL